MKKTFLKPLFFTSTKISADELSDELMDLGYGARAIHGDIPQAKRNRIIEQMKKVRFNI